jgi:protein transport protein SEC24
MMVPAHDFYKTLAAECIANRICVDLYFAVAKASMTIDLATIAPIAGLTGGQTHYYHNFDVTKHGEKIYYALFRALTRCVVTDVQYKARCSTGFTVTEYLGGNLSSATSSMA